MNNEEFTSAIEKVLETFGIPAAVLIYPEGRNKTHCLRFNTSERDCASLFIDIADELVRNPSPPERDH